MQVSAKNFSLFRFFFGLSMIQQVIDLVPHIHDLGKSTFVFHYPYLWFIEAWSHELIDFLKYISIFSAILLGLGIIPRIAAFIFMLAFGYLFLIDISFYNNHYYLWCLIAFLFVITDTHTSISIVDVLRKNTEKKIDITNYVVFGLLISIVYFYAAVAKINGDWLQGYPMRLLTANRGYPFPKILGLIMSYGGLIFDALMPFILWKKPKAWYVILPYFVFHLSNFFTFNIGVFPLVMLAGWLLFLSLSLVPSKELVAAVIPKVKNHTWQSVSLILFFCFQLLFPLRCYWIGGDMAWHRQGHYFAWRMMLHNHEPKFFQYFVVFPDNKENNYSVKFDKLLTYRQLHNTFNDPYFIWLLAQKLKKDAIKKYKIDKVHVYCQSVVTLNQHPEQGLINDTIDLAAVPYHFFTKNNFITTLK